jgi:hypothetical protein
MRIIVEFSQRQKHRLGIFLEAVFFVERVEREQMCVYFT